MLRRANHQIRSCPHCQLVLQQPTRILPSSPMPSAARGSPCCCCRPPPRPPFADLHSRSLRRSQQRDRQSRRRWTRQPAWRKTDAPSRPLAPEPASAREMAPRPLRGKRMCVTRPVDRPRRCRCPRTGQSCCSWVPQACVETSVAARRAQQARCCPSCRRSWLPQMKEQAPAWVLRLPERWRRMGHPGSRQSRLEEVQAHHQLHDRKTVISWLHLPSKLAARGAGADCAGPLALAPPRGSSSSKSNRLTSLCLAAGCCAITGVSFLIGAGARAAALPRLLLPRALWGAAAVRSSSSPASYSSNDSRFAERPPPPPPPEEGYEEEG